MAGKEQINAQDCVCHECDLLVAVPPLHEGEQALCPRCDHVLVQLANNPRQGPLVFVLSSLIMLACANLLPFLAINAKGMMNSMSLFQAASVLFSEDYRVLAIIVFLCMQLLPLSCLLLTGYLYLGLRLWRRPPPLGATVCRWLFLLIPWSMVEVFLVGVLVRHQDRVAGRCIHRLWFLVLLCLLPDVSQVHALSGSQLAVDADRWPHAAAAPAA